MEGDSPGAPRAARGVGASAGAAALFGDRGVAEVSELDIMASAYRKTPRIVDMVGRGAQRKMHWVAGPVGVGAHLVPPASGGGAAKEEIKRSCMDPCHVFRKDGD